VLLDSSRSELVNPSDLESITATRRNELARVMATLRVVTLRDVDPSQSVPWQ
jgi:hypothetical protein